MERDTAKRVSGSEKVRTVMTPDPKTVEPRDSVQKAAQIMRDVDVGAVPVVDAQKGVLGIVTDRDIVLRLVCEGRNPAEAKISDVMTPTVYTAGIDDPISNIYEIMSRQQVRRVPVVDDKARLVGIVALADVAVEDDSPRALADTIEEISTDRSP